MASHTLSTTAKSHTSHPPVTLEPQGYAKSYGDFSGMARNYRSISKANRYCMAYEDYNGTISRYQPADTLSRITDNQLLDFQTPKRIMTLQDVAQDSSSKSTTTTITKSMEAPLLKVQDELATTSINHFQIRSRKEVAEREREDMIREYRRARAIFQDNYWPNQEANALSKFDQARKMQLREDFRNNIKEPVAVRDAINQKNRADTAAQRSELIEHLAQQRQTEWYPEKERFGERLRTHYKEFHDLFEMNETTALATWILEAGLGSSSAK